MGVWPSTWPFDDLYAFDATPAIKKKKKEKRNRAPRRTPFWGWQATLSRRSLTSFGRSSFLNVEKYNVINIENHNIFPAPESPYFPSYFPIPLLPPRRRPRLLSALFLHPRSKFFFFLSSFHPLLLHLLQKSILF